jgi:WhiB family redox-sensing transcriptional regulator
MTVLNKSTPADHVVAPDCPNDAAAGHGYWRAHRRGCICPGRSYEQFVERDKDAKNARRRERGDNRLIDHVTAPPFWAPDVPEPEDLGQETRAVLNSDDAACRSVDPDLFFPVGTGPDAKAQIRQAKAICRACPLIGPCGRAVLDRAEHFGVWAAMTPEERRLIRAARPKAAIEVAA